MSDIHPIQLAVLDLAGTTANENGAVRTAVLTALDQVTAGRGVTRFEEKFTSARGGSKTTMFETLLGDPAQAREAHAKFEQELTRVIKSGTVRPIDGAEHAMRALRDLGVVVALTTGFSPELRNVLIEQLGWQDMIDFALSPQDVGRGRPSPDTALTAALRAGVDDVRAIATVGDTVNDLLAGTAVGAGIVAGVLTGAHSREQLEEAPHTHILPSIAELPRLVEASQYDAQKRQK